MENNRKEKSAIKTQPARKKSNKNRKISMSEFKAWLDGVEEMQPSGWVPNSEQWRTIRDKIETIEIQPNYLAQSVQQFQSAEPRRINSSQFVSTTSQRPEPLMPPIEIPSELKLKLQQMRSTGVPPGTQIGDSGNIKTPDDFSGEQFKSTFE